MLNENKSNLIKPESHALSNQFAKLFNGYSQAFNKSENRTGGLFERPFRRIEITNLTQFRKTMRYIHHNPQNHGLIDDFQDYYYSSFPSYLGLESKIVRSDNLTKFFGSAEAFKEFHVL